MSSIYDISVQTADGGTKALNDFKGKVLLIVNVASKCGFTPQYAGLEKLNQQYKDQGLVILGVPCNDFGGQEPGTAEEIQQFCSMNYGVTFEVLAKVDILGDNKHPLYKLLTEQSEPQGDVKWNFEKFLIAKDGSIAGRFSSKVTPEDAELTNAIEKLL
ncbi:glutathione peroxidase [Paenibacillus radicis (ex Xue et al. 2023)]|uniref:Glutathione peroxidase n=1 Tax=Paenibacillus radicis (ex Xue et al. 2023) TaxID=2972489 RepID=A0ABT1YFT4_9BACL|nr:glutathione peroxidase [Paenibacillus radicis (ex Xue et al. 2023)]MCR8631797.1 glutathione peroxidase [Paenibacillus radicis (ex Xue et al. 2023)]